MPTEASTSFWLPCSRNCAGSPTTCTGAATPASARRWATWLPTPPTRSRGWVDPRRADPAFVAAAWAATDVEERGSARPLLVTAEEVVQAPAPAGARSGSLSDLG